jgi:chromosome segregation ATPase
MEEHTEQKRVMADTYMEEVWEQQAVKNWSKPMHNFGVRQNAFNQSADQRIRALESENLQLRTQIRTLMQQTEELSQIAKRQKERLRQEEQRNREIFGRVAAMLDRMRNDLDRVRLSTQLNSNAIDRLMLEDAAEPEAIEEPLTTMEEPMEEIESAVEIETTADAAESIAPEPEQVTESIDESVSPEMPIEPKDSYAE